MERPLYFDPERSCEERITALLSAMTLDEKIACLGTNPSVPRLGVVGAPHVEGLHGLTLGGPGEWGRDQPVCTTTFPQAIGLAESWDPELLERVAAVEAYETRYLFQSPRYRRGGLVVRAPNADLGRDPRWGRTEECYGEDPYLVSTLVVAFVRGLQGPDPRVWLTASLMKHFLANSNENTRERSSSNFDEQLFYEYYARPFIHGVVKGGSRAFMAAYNKFNQIPCVVHPVLEEVMEHKLGQNGIICTDGGAYQLLVTAHEYVPDLPTAAAAIIRAGVSQFLDKYEEGVREALARGYLTEADVDAVLEKTFRVMLRLGMWDPNDTNPYAAIGGEDELEPWLRAEHQALAREATARSVVLLKNDDQLLPLVPERLTRLAVIGPLADCVLGDWYGGTPPYTVSPFQGILERFGASLEVECVSSNDVSRAVMAARNADVALVCVGNHPTGDAGWAQVTRPSYGKEAVDRESLTLEDERLLRRVLHANPKTVLVLISSFPYAIGWAQEHVPAIVHLTHASQELGRGLADVLAGAVNPAGRLVQTWPRSLDQLPDLLDYDLRHGHTYLFSRHEPLYCFGHGLSYSSFEYGCLVFPEQVSGAEEFTVVVPVRNESERDGEEVVQLYLEFHDSLLERPKRALAAFERVMIPAGATRAVRLVVRPESLSSYSNEARDFVLEPGRVQLHVGSSLTDIRSTGLLRLDPSSPN